MSSVAPPAADFAELLPLEPAAVAALRESNIVTPTPIQRAAMARVHAGESLLLHAETGSGKSLAFLLPTLARLGHAGAAQLGSAQAKVLVAAPTRELAVQLANEAATLLPPDAVQIVAVGAVPEPGALLAAACIVCTPAELLSLLEREGDKAGVVDSLLSQVRVLVLDEMDALLPVGSVYGRRAAQIKKQQNKKAAPSAAEALVRAVIEASSAEDLQLVAASATLSRPTRLKLGRILRRDPLARWYDAAPAIVRPAEIDDVARLSAAPRAVVIPSGVRHKYMRVRSSVKLRRAMPAAPKRAASPRRVSLKQRRADKAAAARDRRLAPAEGEAHPLLASLAEALATVRPSSGLVFLCRSSGLTVRRAARELAAMGVPALPLHEAIGLERAPPTLGGAPGEAGPPTGLDGGSAAPALRGAAATAAAAAAAAVADPSGELRQRHQALSAAFSAHLPGGSAGDAGQAASDAPSEPEGGRAVFGVDERTPLVVTFEEMARGLHFDAVDAVFIVGIPDSPSTYLHLAGRTGRQPVLQGTVVTLCPGAAHENLLGWSTRLGGIEFEELEVGGEAAEE